MMAELDVAQRLLLGELVCDGGGRLLLGEPVAVEIGRGGHGADLQLKSIAEDRDQCALFGEGVDRDG